MEQTVLPVGASFRTEQDARAVVASSSAAQISPFSNPRFLRSALMAVRSWRRAFGPGLVAAAADDDPSGIATYSQVGAQFGYGLGWVMLISYPLMAAIQEISARIGYVTGQGIAGNIRAHYSAALLRIAVLMLLAANIINLGADIGAMGAALKLLIGGPEQVYAALFGVLCVTLMLALTYLRYVALLKRLCLSLLAYVASALMVHVSWHDALAGLLVPSIRFSPDYLTAILALLGTTISPYVFFWQAQLEAEDRRTCPGSQVSCRSPCRAPRELRRIRHDTLLGTGFAVLIALFIMFSATATLHAAGIVNIQTSAEAAEALRPIAGDLAFALFAAGIIGTGMLAVPVLAGSTAYAVAEAFGWPNGLAQRITHAKAFYATVAVATLAGLAMNFIGVDPVRALYWSAVVNGLLAPPLMAAIIVLASSQRVMGEFVLRGRLRIGGWIATGIMSLTAVGLLASWVA